VPREATALFARLVSGSTARVAPGRWDYRHQVIAQAHLSRRQLFFAVKLMELAFHLHPARLRRLLAAPDPFRRRQARWAMRHTGAVWFAETGEFAAGELRAAWEGLRRGGEVRLGWPAASPSHPCS
jgi:hypothetical protein